MQRKKIVFLGSKPIGYACFAHLLSVRDSLGIDVCGLLTQARKEFGEGHDLNQLAEQHGVPLLKSMDELPECDIIYSVQYHQILKPQHIEKAKQIAVNLHMAPLPEYRGSNQFSFAIIDKKKEFGTTIHKIDPRIDHGDILFQKRFGIPEGCWVNDLYELTYAASLALFKETLPSIIADEYTMTSQASLVEQYGSNLHYRDEINKLKEIDMSWDEEKIQRYIRATSMPGFEPPYHMVEGKKIYFTENES